MTHARYEMEMVLERDGSHSGKREKPGAESRNSAAEREKTGCETVKPRFNNKFNDLQEKITQTHSSCEAVRY